MEYAKNNGIEVKIQYEENERNQKKFNQEKTYPQNKEETTQNTQNNTQNTQTQQAKKYYNNNNTKKPYTKPNNNYRKNYNNNDTGNYQQGANHMYNKNPNMYFSNKFDSLNNQQQSGMYPMMPMMSPMNQNPNMYYPNYQAYPNQNQGNQIEESTDNSDKSVLESLEYYFSEENLNKDSYIRSKMSDEGFVEAIEIVNFNKMKNKGVTLERLEEILESNKDSVLETVLSEDKLYLRNREWESIKEKLLPLESILQQRKFNKKNFNSTMNYVSMQNNFFYQMQPTGGMYPPNMMMPGMDMNMNHMFVQPMQPNMGGYQMPPQFMGGEGMNMNNMNMPNTYMQSENNEDVNN